MIYCLVQSADAHSGLAVGRIPAGLLDDRERESFERLKTAKRRRDWLLGRWTAKLLVQDVLRRATGRTAALNDLPILNDAWGAPEVSSPPGLPGLALSISHCNGRAFCAVADQPGLRLGADMERLEPRSPSFAAEYFTAVEIAWLDQVPQGARDLLVTAVWSAKEAALKALRLGLSVDTRSVECCFPPFTGVPQEWAAYKINYQTYLLNAWWRVWEDYVLTLASF